MKAELLGDTTFKITLDKAEAENVPSDGQPREMHRFICGMIERLNTEQELIIPNGRLLVEAFLKSDGSYVFFISALTASDKLDSAQRLFACDIEGIPLLRSLCLALSETGAECSIFCGSDNSRYRLVFTDPDDNIKYICKEYGELAEISSLFAAQTEEYLTPIAEGNSIRLLAELLG